MTCHEALTELITLADDSRSLELLGQIADDSAGECAPYAASDVEDLRRMFDPLLATYRALGMRARDKRAQIIWEDGAVKVK